MRIFKRFDRQVGGWYYRDSKDRRVSPTYEHEGVLGKWAELHGVREVFNVVLRSTGTEAEQVIGPYGDYKTADLRERTTKAAAQRHQRYAPEIHSSRNFRIKRNQWQVIRATSSMCASKQA